MAWCNPFLLFLVVATYASGICSRRLQDHSVQKVGLGYKILKFLEAPIPYKRLDRLACVSKRLSRELQSLLKTTENVKQATETVKQTKSRLSKLQNFSRRHRAWLQCPENCEVLAKAILGGKLAEFRAMYGIVPELAKLKYLQDPAHILVLKGFSHLCDNDVTVDDRDVPYVNTMMDELYKVNKNEFEAFNYNDLQIYEYGERDHSCRKFFIDIGDHLANLVVDVRHSLFY